MVLMTEVDAENMTETEVWRKAREEIVETNMIVTGPPHLQDTEGQDQDLREGAEIDLCLPEMIGEEDVDFKSKLTISAVDYDNVNVLYKIHPNTKSEVFLILSDTDCAISPLRD